MHGGPRLRSAATDFCRPTTGRTRAYGYPRQNYSENDPHIQAQARVLRRVVNAGGSVHDLVEANFEVERRAGAAPNQHASTSHVAQAEAVGTRW